MQKKRFLKCGELAFVLGVVLLALGTAVMAKAELGMGVTVAPTYILSGAAGAISVGTMNYLYQGALVIASFVIARRFRLTFLFTFFAAVLFGLLVDLFTWLLAGLSPSGLAVRIVLFAVGEVLNAMGIAFLLQSYFPPQAPELFVKQLARRCRWDVYKTKYGYDICSFALSLTLSLLFFGRLRYIGVGTVVCAFVNGPLISFFGHGMNRFMDFSPRFPAIAKLFEEQPATSGGPAP